MQATRLMITNEQVKLVSVSGRLDGAGLRALQQKVDLLLDAGARFLLTDLSRVESCDVRCSICSPAPATSSSSAAAGFDWSYQEARW